MQFGARGLLIALLFSIVAAGCTSNDTEGTSEEERAATAEIMAADTVWAKASMEGLTWDVPGSFQPVVPSTSMRIAQYELPSTDKKVRPGELAVIFFGPGIGGKPPENLDQWIDQFRQPDRTDSKEKAVVDSFLAAGNLEVTTIRLDGIYEPPSMNEKPGFDFPGWALYGACIEGEGGPWFFRAVGPATVIERHIESLGKVYRGVRASS